MCLTKKGQNKNENNAQLKIYKKMKYFWFSKDILLQEKSHPTIIKLVQEANVLLLQDWVGWG